MMALWGCGFLLLLVLGGGTLAAARPVYVSCVGDSITWGSHASNRSATYPAMLQKFLGDGYVVSNFGRSGTTMLKKGDFPYWGTPEYDAFFNQTNPVDIVLIMFGTNDGKDRNWLPYGSQYEPDYYSFLDEIKSSLGSEVRVMPMIPPPVYATKPSSFNPHTVNVIIPPIVRRVIYEHHLQVIDIFNFMGGRALSHPEYFAEGVHPNDEGYAAMAKFISQVIVAGPPRPAAPVTDRKISIVCVGDSITAGHGSTDQTHAYPEVLGTLLGPDFEVLNLGVGGKTMMKTADGPYWDTDAYQQFLKTTPDIVTIMMGTNDGKNHNWLANSSLEFFNDYSEFVKITQNLPTKPIIHLMVPPPLYIDGVYDMNSTLINNYVHDLVPKIAAANNVNGQVISVFDLLGGSELLHPEYISDGCHPTNLGYYQIALKLAEVIVQDKLGLIE
eukprot:TRINITY_DN1300_c0_g1_i1.p1 TRINITY_DN1300_c0_g1~~TRINITY_DN1300_c0_g1_i1.p1  ORF type:complete len:442 (-),score=110.56 TRINITY_DN1300_c0_g1_i1:142-1467(-)